MDQGGFRLDCIKVMQDRWERFVLDLDGIDSGLGLFQCICGYGSHSLTIVADFTFGQDEFVYYI